MFFKIYPYQNSYNFYIKLNPLINLIYLQKCSVTHQEHQTMAISKAMGHIRLVM